MSAEVADDSEPSEADEVELTPRSPAAQAIGRSAFAGDSGLESPVALSELADDADEEHGLLDGTPNLRSRAAADKAPPEVSHTRVMLLVAGHALSASGLVVINKWAQMVFPFVWTLTSLQFSFAAGLVFCLGKLGVLDVEPLELKKVFKFFPAAGMFFITITAGNAVIGKTNVDTFIVMRSLVPIPSAILEALLLKEPCPRPQSWAGLATICVGALMYAFSNQGLVVNSMAWVGLFLALAPLDAVLIKHIVNSSGLGPWSLVLYNNICAVLPGIFFSLLLEFRIPDDREAILAAAVQPAVILPVVLSCFSGVSISYFQLNVRGVISSTAFMVLGVANKFLSVAIGQFAKMDANSSWLSVGAVLGSMGGAILFQQTVKGKGISQAPRSDFKGSAEVSCAAVIFGIGAAAAISYLQKRGALGG